MTVRLTKKLVQNELKNELSKTSRRRPVLSPTRSWDRRQVAAALGVSYSTLRVYERHLKGLLHLERGPNRTTLYPRVARELVAQAVELKRAGTPFTKLVDNLSLELVLRTKINELERDVASLSLRLLVLERGARGSQKVGGG